MKLVEALEKLSNANGVTGREGEVRELMKKSLKPYVDEIREDKLGNLIAFKKGNKDAPTVMLAAHMDEVGLMIKNIKKKGFLQFKRPVQYPPVSGAHRGRFRGSGSRKRCPHTARKGPQLVSCSR